MAGNLTGGKKAAQTTKERFGKDFYAKIGAVGGRRGTTGGFYADRENASAAGSLGGRRSRKGLKFIRETSTFYIYERKSDDKEIRIRR